MVSISEEKASQLRYNNAYGSVCSSLHPLWNSYVMMGSHFSCYADVRQYPYWHSKQTLPHALLSNIRELLKITCTFSCDLTHSPAEADISDTRGRLFLKIYCALAEWALLYLSIPPEIEESRGTGFKGKNPRLLSQLIVASWSSSLLHSYYSL